MIICSFMWGSTSVRIVYLLGTKQIHRRHIQTNILLIRNIVYTFTRMQKCSPYNYDSAKTYYISKKEPERNDNWGHPTQKPVEFIERMIRNSSDVGDVVYDPFMGSGTTAVACVRNGRKYIGSEINHKFYSASVERLVAAGDNTVNVNDECRLW